MYDESNLPCTDYNSNVSELPIDGQVYEFLFCPSDGEEDQKCADFSLNSLVIRAFSNPSYNSDETYTWVITSNLSLPNTITSIPSCTIYSI